MGLNKNSIGKRLPKSTALLLTLLIFVVLLAFPTQARADEYYAADKTAIDALTTAKGLSPNYGITWSDDAQERRVIAIHWRQSNISGSLNFTAFAELTILDISNNISITDITIDGLSKLEKLYCGGTNIKGVNFSGLTSLWSLNCEGLGLTGLNLSNFPNLTELICNNNALATLDLSPTPNLTNLECNKNQLTTLDVSGLNHLVHLDCSSNLLRTVVLGSLDAWTFLDTTNNQLTYLATEINGKALEISRIDYGYVGVYYWGANNSYYIQAQTQDTRDDEVFVKWTNLTDDTSQSNNEQFSLDVNEDNEYKARFGYNVTFKPSSNQSDDFIIKAVMHTAIGEANKPANPSNEGYSFVGWFENPNTGNDYDVWSFKDSIVDEPITLYAKWNILKFTFTFNYQYEVNNETLKSNQTYNYNSYIVEPTKPVRVGFDFIGWYKETTYETLWSFNNDRIRSDTEIYAKWLITSYPVTFDRQNGNTSVIQVQHGSTATRPAINPERDGHIFLGWYKEAAGTTEWNFTTDLITAATTIYAKWQVLQYNVNFNFMYDDITETLKYNYDSDIANPPTRTREYYEFKGWFKDAGFQNAWTSTDRVKDDTTLYAKWELKQYNVTFNSQNGTSNTIIQVSHGTAIPATDIPQNPTREGYNFTGWASDRDGTTAFDFATPITRATTIYAQWEIIILKLNFDYQISGYEYVPATAEYWSNLEKEINAVEIPQREEYDFIGWYKDPDCFNLWNTAKDQLKQDNTTLYAKWKIKEYNVKLNYQDGRVLELTIEHGSYLDEQIIAQREGYVFVGWCYDPAGSIPWNFATDQVKSDIILYAKWEVIEYYMYITPNNISPAGGYVEVTIIGSNLINGIDIEVYDEADEKSNKTILASAKTSGTLTEQKATVYIPSNTSIATKNYIFRSTTDSGNNYKAPTATLVVGTLDPPKVQSVIPTGSNVDISGYLVITFNREMDINLKGTVKLGDTAFTEKSIWTTNRTYRIPYQGLNYGTSYTIDVSGFKDTNGNLMAQDKTNSFTTVNIPTPPKITYISPSSTGAELSGELRILFDKAMDKQQHGTIKLGGTVLSVGEWSATNNQEYAARYSVSGYNTIYSLEVSGFQDMFQTSMNTDSTWKFTTKVNSATVSTSPQIILNPVLLNSQSEVEISGQIIKGSRSMAATLDYRESSSKTWTNLWSRSNEGTFTTKLTNLKSNKEYEYRLTAEDSSSVTVTQSRSFIIPASSTTGLKISGDIINNSGSDQDIIVTLEQGNTIIRSDKALKTSGAAYLYTYSFENVPDGIYQIVANNGSSYTTIGILIDSTSKLNSANKPQAITISQQKSLIEVLSSDVPVSSILGLADIFNAIADGDQNGYTQSDSGVIQTGGTVIITASLDKLADSTSNSNITLLKEGAKTNDHQLNYFLDFSLFKTVNPANGDRGLPITLNEIPQAIDLKLETPSSLKNRSSLAVYRIHNGVVEAVPEYDEKLTQAEYFLVEGKYMTLHVKKFSTYALGYYSKSTTTTTTGGGGGGGGGGGSSSSSSSGGSSGGGGVGAIPEPSHLYESFTDISNHWANNEIRYVVENNLFNGTSETTFSPNQPITRGMIVTVLYRYEGQPSLNSTNPFKDIASGRYYTNGVIWAYENKIVSGIGNDKYAPDANLTREELANILYGYAKYKGASLAAPADISGYADAHKVSTWAKDTLKWAVGEGLISGKANNLIAPADQASRAETAVILQRFITNCLD